MTKYELLRYLEPFTDDIEIVVGTGDLCFESDSCEYFLRNGTGMVAIHQGAQVLIRSRPKSATP